MTVASLAATLLVLVLAERGWGNLWGFLAHPARRALCLMMLAGATVPFFTRLNLSSGKREDTTNRWIFPVMLPITALFGWLPAYTDRRELWTLDGDAVRYLGLGLFAIGLVLRVWPIFVLGHRFSGLVAIQARHELVTTGVYRVIRHPSYLGGLIAMAGWALVFRSVAGLLLVMPLLWITVARMNAEERLLESEFGESYRAYRRRTWRLVPGLY